MWVCLLGLENCLPSAQSNPGICAALSGQASEKSMASEGGDSSYGNVHQMAELQPRTAAPGGRRQHLGEAVPLRRWAPRAESNGD